MRALKSSHHLCSANSRGAPWRCRLGCQKNDDDDDDATDDDDDDDNDDDEHNM